jgi:prepilin-type N-terminal cleavage/methylation domain-containing protein
MLMTSTSFGRRRGASIIELMMALTIFGLAANVAVGGATTSNNTVSGNATFHYSGCALMSALRGSATR